ncbi:MAG: HAD-IIIA family hydrolase [Pseudomonadota bacterium]
MTAAVPEAVQRKATAVRLAVFDVDGVMTDGRLYYDEAGRELKAFFTQDGLGLKHLMRAGTLVGIITGRDNPIVNHRMAELGITRLVAGCDDKGPALATMADDAGVDLSETAYVGDDLIDVPALKRAGLAISVPNAHASALAVAHWVTPRPGGNGAVRDVCDLIMPTGAAG